MASLLPGFEYDIFISYRQKDNKGDRWVSEFVDNLKGELESTFKEEISVYFDNNPYDGLLETHDIDASLKEKLKCLIFIPIISRTYCDPKSFAWEHELKAFIDQASKDQFGLKIKLPNGNVASRVLPVRIHDLDIDDIKQCEPVLGGVLRGVEFVYKTAGVNRPLRANEDHPQDNFSKTYYRDQINKVANAINEIITGLTREPAASAREMINQKGPSEKEGKLKKRIKHLVPFNLSKHRVISGVAIITILIIGALLLYPKIFKNDSELPLVIIMDSSHPTRVYDEEIIAVGGTNADVISDILLDLPIRRQRETIGPSWHRDEEILKFQPYLIIIHYSGFNQGYQSAPRVRLKSFINFIAESDTRFLIYSRRKEIILREEVDSLFADLEVVHSGLLSRIDVFGVDDYGPWSWLSPLTANALKLRVKEILKEDNKLSD
ncbi:MAG: hypothetical protein A2X03_09985 [Bacteroidetes bacterium GWA2_40_15]|nr:MAG: hypothetical protein A2X03_09985 [Bacteroidetes bacterium GWA2_40_15]OFX87068.1 MAG: hypothetical protein A2X06_03340 [Bacteroidetes bacterium GWC2_40_22]HBH82637.1 hypothetical protein [Bacteroidales bacterium]HBQ82154.1 hypothetical protein [Bacteroidales bacterium]